MRWECKSAPQSGGDRYPDRAEQPEKRRKAAFTGTKSSIKQGVDFHVAIGDIDDFKHVNDTYGHECGDVVLKEISKLMKKSMLGKGFAARWGGEEFLLVFKGMDLDAASDVLSGFLGEVRKKEIPFNDQIVKVTMTFGIVTGDAERLERIVSEADKKLYYGKNNGKNQIVKQI